MVWAPVSVSANLQPVKAHLSVTCDDKMCISVMTADLKSACHNIDYAVRLFIKEGNVLGQQNPYSPKNNGRPTT